LARDGPLHTTLHSHNESPNPQIAGEPPDSDPTGPPDARLPVKPLAVVAVLGACDEDQRHDDGPQRQQRPSRSAWRTPRRYAGSSQAPAPARGGGRGEDEEDQEWGSLDPSDASLVPTSGARFALTETPLPTTTASATIGSPPISGKGAKPPAGGASRDRLLRERLSALEVRRIFRKI